MNPVVESVDLVSFLFLSATLLIGGVGTLVLLWVFRSLRSSGASEAPASSASSQQPQPQPIKTGLRQHYVPRSLDYLNDNEEYVSNSLRKLDKRFYVVLDDIQLPSNGSRVDSAQIDHIVVSNFGIFVVETKGYRGYIFGDKTDAKWTQCRYDKTRQTFINPVRQNYGHTQALHQLLGSRSSGVIHSLCVFPFADKLFIKDVDTVFDTRGTLDYIDKHFRREVFTDDEVNGIVSTIINANQTSAYHRDRHNAQVSLLATS